MKYTLKFDNKNNLSGWQTIKYEMNGQEIEENQFFVGGSFHDGFINVSGVGSTMYTFTFDSWKNWEIMRDMVEGFVMDYEFNFTMLRSRDNNNVVRMFPNNEEVFVS